jgi:signal transduction histidine kinase
MHDLADRLRRFAASRLADLLLAAVVLAWTLAYLFLIAPPSGRPWLALASQIPYAASLAVRRRWPVAAGALACVSLLIVRPLGLTQVMNRALTVPISWTPFLLAYTLGTSTAIPAGLGLTVALAASLQVVTPGSFNPIFEMMTVGPWLVGRVMLSRRRMNEQLQVRNDELLAEQELFAQESVRYERARIARELHDIVAHCLSVMVVQASAGQRVAGPDRESMTEALECVAEAAGQAQTEIGRLVELLGGELPSSGPPGLQMVDELVRRASATGTAISCRFLGACDGLTAAASEAAYRVVQEALTNALKHAPGAPVDIAVHEQGDEVAVDVVNAAAKDRPSGLERSGGSYGLAGMRERVAACGGSLASGPTADGGWHVSALLPAGSPQVFTTAERR